MSIFGAWTYTLYMLSINLTWLLQLLKLNNFQGDLTLLAIAHMENKQSFV